MQSKIWFIYMDGQKEGPYTLFELKRHPRMTPDTLVWKEGFKTWIPARKIPELQSLFKNENAPPKELGDLYKIETPAADETALAIEGSNFPYFLFWLAILLVLFAYLFYEWSGF